MNPKTHSAIAPHDIAPSSGWDRGTVSVLRQGPEGPYYNHIAMKRAAMFARYVPAEQVPDLQAA